MADILADVQARGDAAVLEYTARFDGLQADSMAALELTKQELKAAFDGLPAGEPFTVADELTGRTFTWTNDNYVSLAPWADVAHVLSVKR